MYEYLPWSQKVLDDAIVSYKEGTFTILDLELGGGCNLNCVYCDSPDRSKKFTFMKEIQKLIETDKFKWIFICGLGEPTFAENKNDLIAILELCKVHGIKCSIFTNLLDFDDRLFQYVEDDVLYVMFKLDSFVTEKIKKLYGKQKIDVERLNKNIKKLVTLVKVENGCTNLCASIVPTALNYDELSDIISFCNDNNIFPLIGDLEDSGRGQDVYQQLKLSDKKLEKVKSLFSEGYEIPICPSVLCGIHILYDGTVALDESTGLSCHWFWLTEPRIYQMKKVQQYVSLEQIEKEIIEYRNGRILQVKENIKKLDKLVFGGCGGDIKTLLEKYVRLHLV